MPGFVFWGTKAQHINIYGCKCESKTYKSVNYSLLIMSLLTNCVLASWIFTWDGGHCTVVMAELQVAH